MKITHLLKHGMHGNGSVHVAVDLACAQADSGHEVVLACARPFYAELLTSHGVEVVTLAEARDVRTAARATAELLRLLRGTRPDVIHAHMMSSAVLAYPLAKAMDVPLVTTMHNSFDRHSVLMRLGDVVVAVSRAENELLVSRGYPAAKVVTIVNGATGSPREALDGSPLALPTPSVVALSGLHRRKAVGDLVTAFDLIRDDHPEWHLNIVGSGPDEDVLRAQVKGTGLTDRVHLHGSTLTPQPALRDSAIFATATLADPCPLAVMEARSAGCAIVGTAVGGIPETLEYGRAGYLVPPQDPVAMAGALGGLMSDPDQLRQAQLASVRGSAYFSVPRMADDYVRLFESVIDGGPVRRPSQVPLGSAAGSVSLSS